MYKDTPVLFRLDDNNEAFDVVWLCSTICRDKHTPYSWNGIVDPVAPGVSGDWVDGTVCEECGRQLPAK
jgi:hypothetical protein